MDGTKELPANLKVRLFKSIAATDFVGRLMGQLQHFPILGSGSVSDLPVTQGQKPPHPFANSILRKSELRGLVLFLLRHPLRRDFALIPDLLTPSGERGHGKRVRHVVKLRTIPTPLTPHHWDFWSWDA